MAEDTVFQAPFASRARSTEEGDGFEMCEHASIVIQNSVLLLYDGTSRTLGPLVAVPLASLTGIKTKRFVSAGRTFYGGRIELLGNFGRPWEEKIILKMEMHEYNRMKRALRPLACNKTG